MFQHFSDLPAFRRDPLGFILARGRSTTDVAPVRVGLHPIYMLTDPTLIRTVLKADEAAIDKGRLIYKLREVIGTSSLTISGPEHRARRAVIHRTFAEGLAGAYVPQIGSVVRGWVVDLARQGSVDAHPVSARLALRVICAILFGEGAMTPADEAAIVEAVALVEDDLAEEMFRALPHTPWARRRKKRKLQAAREIMSMVTERLRQRAGALSLLRSLEALGLEGEVLRDEVLLILLSGHHTTGSATAWLLYHLATDETLRGRLAAEATRISGQSGDLTPLSIRSASISRAFVSEILRLYPSTYWMSRELQHDQTVAGRRMKRGTSLLISQWHLHRDPRFWDDPEAFRLDREWLSNPAYMPFGFGGRACVGLNVAMLEMQMIALEVALSLDVAVISATHPSPPKPSVTLVPPSIRLRLTPRAVALSEQSAAA